MINKALSFHRKHFFRELGEGERTEFIFTDAARRKENSPQNTAEENQIMKKRFLPRKNAFAYIRENYATITHLTS